MGLFKKKDKSDVSDAVATDRAIDKAIKGGGLSFLGSMKNFNRVELEELVSKGSNAMMVAGNPFTPPDKKRKVLNELFDSLSDTTFLKVGEIFMGNVTISEENCHKFENSEAQTDSFMSRYPRLEPVQEFRDTFLNKAQKNRQRLGLVV